MDLPIAPLARYPLVGVDALAHHAVAWRASARPRGLHGRFAGAGDVHVAGERLAVEAASVWQALRYDEPIVVQVGRPGRHWKPRQPAALGQAALRGVGEILDGPWGWSGTALPVPDYLGPEAAAVRSVERRRYALAEDAGFLDVALFDVGTAVEFGAIERGRVDPTAVRLDGQALDGAFMGLDLRRDDVGRFFETFGAPPDLGYDERGRWADIPWSARERRWISIARIRGVQDDLFAAVQAGHVPAMEGWSGAGDGEPARPPVYGQVLADAIGAPLWQLDLWQAIGAMAALDLARGAIGFCEAPREHGKGVRCGRPFLVGHQERRYCSARCQSRVSTQRYARSLREAQA